MDWIDDASAYITVADSTPRRRVQKVLADIAGALHGIVSGWAPLIAARLKHYHGSRQRLELYVPPRKCTATGPSMLLVNPDFSGGGAPKLLFELARVFLERNYRLLLVTAEDGPLREDFVASGVPVLIDPYIRWTGTGSIAALGRSADTMVANTVLAHHAVRELSPRLPCFWYIHEISILEHVFALEPRLSETFSGAAAVWTGSELPAVLIRPYRADVEVIPYGVDPIASGGLVSKPADTPLRIALLASIEPRKGQDLAVAALKLLSPAERQLLRLEIYGRVTDAAFADSLHQAATGVPEIAFFDQLNSNDYKAVVAGCDAVLLSSRDDTLPIVSLDALGAGKILMCTPATGTAAYLNDGVDGFIADTTDPAGIAAMLSRMLVARHRWPFIGRAGKAVFDDHFARAQFTARVGSAVDAAVVRGEGAVSCL